MLRKLLKYDLRANMKIYLFIWPAVILFAIIERIAISVDLDGKLGTVLVSTTTTLFVLGVIAACVFALIVSVVRFYSGLLRDEGYLMFTLPVKPWQLVLSKFLTALLTCTVTFIVCALSSWYLLDGIHGFYEIMDVILNYLKPSENLMLLLVVLILFAAVCEALLQIYLSCSIGQLFKKHRVMWSVLTYFGISVLIEIVSVTSLVGLNLWNIFDEVTQSATARINLVLAAVLAVQLALCTLYYFLTERILRKNLNLE